MSDMAIDPAEVEARIGEKIIGTPPEEPVEPPPDETPAEPAEPEFELPEHLRGKSAEEIARMHLELERKLGEQGRELGEYRKRVEEQEYEPEPDTYQPGPVSRDDLAIFDEIVQESPEKAAQIAKELRHPFLYERALSAWMDFDEASALRFDFQTQLDQRDEQLMQRLAPVFQQSQNQQWYEAWGRLRGGDAPDIDSYAHAMTQVMRDNPALVKALGTAQGAEREQLMRLAYHAARSLTGNVAPQPGSQPGAAPPAPHVASGETGRLDTKPAKVDVVSWAIRQAYAAEPSIEAGLSSG